MISDSEIRILGPHAKLADFLVIAHTTDQRFEKEKNARHRAKRGGHRRDHLRQARRDPAVKYP